MARQGCSARYIDIRCISLVVKVCSTAVPDLPGDDGGTKFRSGRPRIASSDLRSTDKPDDLAKPRAGLVDLARAG